MSTPTSALPLLRVLQLASSNLPVGGFSFSNGLEYAIESQQLRTVEHVKSWISHVADVTLGYTDIPIIKRQFAALEHKDWATFHHWNTYVLAMRETKELRQADVVMGRALYRLVKSFDVSLPESPTTGPVDYSYISLFSVLANHFALSLNDACAGHAWTFIENQVLAATKLLPMGQTAAQLMLTELAAITAESIHRGLAVEDQYIGIGLPGLAISSAMHESQYSRLYAS